MPSPAFTPFDTVALIGVGMMGGSLGLELRRRGLARQVVGIDRNAGALDRAREMGILDAATTEASEGVGEADCVICATPVGAIPELLEAIAPVLRADALVTDLGSTKRSIVAAGERLFGARFVGGHPMAGSPVSGLDGVRPNLFAEAAWAIVRSVAFSLADPPDPFVGRLAALASALGARPMALDAARHDRLVALVSHLPHALAFAFSALVAEDADADLARGLAGGSYRDLMRVADADPALWEEIFRDNRVELLTALTRFEERLLAIRRRFED